MLTGKILDLDAYVRKEEKLKTQWCAYPSEEGRKNKLKWKETRRKRIKIRIEISEIVNIQQINKAKSCFFEIRKLILIPRQEEEGITN